MLCSVLVGTGLVSCGAQKQATKPSCPSVGQRIGEQAVHGVIYGSVGAKAEVPACPHMELPFAFVGTKPDDYARLKELAEQRQDVLGFNAVGDGYIVTDGPGEYVLVLITLDDVREDPSVAKRARAATS
jgi:hypothetical protein